MAKKKPGAGEPGFSTLTSRPGPQARDRSPAIAGRSAKNVAAGKQVPAGAKQKKPGLGIEAGLPRAVGDVLRGMTHPAAFKPTS
jgi:hypothetical protein